MPVEEWRPVAEAPGYEVSSLGNVRCGKRVPVLQPGRGEQHALYPRFWARDEWDRRIRVNLHQAVCAAFHGPRPSEDHWALHGDDDPTNNAATNLRWGTRTDNRRDMLRNGIHAGPSSEGAAAAKLMWPEVREIRRMWATGAFTKTSLGEEFGVSRTQIRMIVYGLAWAE